MKILFCGASVTAQNVNKKTSEVSGYFPVLQSILPKSIRTERLAYGSQQFGSMGIFSLSKIIEINPDLVFLEWMTTGEKRVDPNQIISTTTMLRKHGIGVVWLLLPRLDRQAHTSKYETVFSLKSKITILSVMDHIEHDTLSLILRDLVHTNSNGATLYARTIKDGIDKAIEEELRRLEEVAKQYSVDYPLEHLSSEEHALLYKEIDASCELMIGSTLKISVSDSKKIGFWCETNPIAPVLCVNVNQQPLNPVTIIDQWSFYSRMILKPIIALNANSLISLWISDQLPDYSLACPKLLTAEHKESIPKDLTSLIWKLESVFIQRDAKFVYSVAS